MPVAGASTSSTPAPSPSSSAAPASVAVDFMAMLGQLAAAPAPALPVGPAGANLPALKEAEELDTDPEATDTLGMMPLSLPVMPTEGTADAAGTHAALLSVATGAGKGAAVAPEAQLLTDLIQPEQLSGAGKFEIPQLTATNESASPLRQAESAHSRPVQVPVGTAQWADEIGSRMTLMVEQGKHTASLRLSPEHLGPLEVRITMNGDQASVQFGAAHADTRHAIENALPRLREMFASQGLSLADANVSREPPRQQHSPASQSSSSSSGGFASDDTTTAVAAAQVRLGLFDAYA